MKKIAHERQVVIEHLNEARVAKKIRRKLRKSKLLSHHGIATVKVPNHMDLETNYEETVAFFIRIKSISLLHKDCIFFDFADLQSISPEAAILLVAEIYRIKQKIFKDKHRPPAVNGNFPQDSKLWYILDELGFYKLLNLPRINHQYTLPDVTVIKYITDKLLIGENLAQFFQDISLFRHFEDNIDEFTKKKQYDSIAEAVSNVMHHAYPEGQIRKYPVLHNQWWMSGFINDNLKSVSLLFCDQGVGIPYTLPLTFKERFKKPLQLLNDNDATYIKEAVKLGKSRMQIDGRGNGLHDIVSFIENLNNNSYISAKLRIVSNKGEYRLGRDGEEMIEHKNSIFGTFIEINVQRLNQE